MKFCENCMTEIGTRDGDNLCAKCDAAVANGKRRKANKQRREREAILRAFGLTKVRGALGGTYWE